MRIDFYKFIDKYFGIIVIFLLNLLKFNRKRSHQINRVLVIKLWAIGDSVVSLPLIRSIKKNFPNAKVDVLAKKRNYQIFKMVDFIDNIIFFEPKNFFKLVYLFNRYDIVFDLEPYLNISAVLSFLLGKFSIGFADQFRSRIYDKTVLFNKNQHMVENYLDFIVNAGGKVSSKEYNLVKLNCYDIYKPQAKMFSKYARINYIHRKLVGVCVGTAESAAKTRVWEINKWAALCDIVIDKFSLEVLFFGSNNEKEVINKIQSVMKNKSINVAGELTLEEVVCLISKCDLFISIDTGLMHISAAQGVKTIGLFGPNTPKLWQPYGKNNFSVYKNLNCSPCIQNDKGYMPDCLRTSDRYACMNLITVDEVFYIAKSLLKNS